MPEGPEILCITTCLKDKFIGGKIKLSQDIINTLIEINENNEIIDIFCKGKLLFIKIKSDNNFYYLHIHLGLTGWVIFKNPKNVKYTFIINKNNKEYDIFIEDKTRLSKLEIHNEEEHNKIINKLGIDIFTKEFTLEKFKQLVKSKNMIFASFLLKQELFCGIGNYIKNEILYMNNLDINIKTKMLSDEQIEQVHKDILFVGYSNLIEQLRNINLENKLQEHNKINMPSQLEVPYEYKIYKRNTTKDGKIVKITKVGGRDTYYVE